MMIWQDLVQKGILSGNGKALTDSLAKKARSAIDEIRTVKNPWTSEMTEGRVVMKDVNGNVRSVLPEAEHGKIIESKQHLDPYLRQFNRRQRRSMKARMR